MKKKPPGPPRLSRACRALARPVLDGLFTNVLGAKLDCAVDVYRLSAGIKAGPGAARKAKTTL